MSTNLLKIDDSGIQRVFGSIDDKLNRHERMILELQRLLQDSLSRRDLDNLKAELRAEFDKRLKSLEQHLSSKIDARAELIERDLRANLAAAQSDVAAQLKTISDLRGLGGRLANVETITKQTNKQLNEIESRIKAVADCYCRVSGKSAVSIDQDFERQLNPSTILITDSFKSIFDRLSDYETDLAQVRELTTRTREPAPVNLDISGADPRPEFAASWRDPPELPAISKFRTIRDSVDFLYELHPKLQAYLKALHGRVVDNVNQLSGIMDRDALEKLLERLRQAIVEMDAQVAELRRALRKGLSRADVLSMISDAIASSRASETAIGTVRCIACGKETRQVAGAIGEADAVRRLGQPANALVLLTVAGGGRMGELYSNPDELLGIESPRSVRPFRSPPKVTKQYLPRPPPPR
jgi:DNA repair exonuclease SbcCD ATPase subunit